MAVESKSGPTPTQLRVMRRAEKDKKGILGYASQTTYQALSKRGWAVLGHERATAEERTETLAQLKDWAGRAMQAAEKRSVDAVAVCAEEMVQLCVAAKRMVWRITPEGRVVLVHALTVGESRA